MQHVSGFDAASCSSHLPWLVSSSLWGTIGHAGDSDRGVNTMD
jgi:hypothetical protein